MAKTSSINPSRPCIGSPYNPFKGMLTTAHMDCSSHAGLCLVSPWPGIGLIMREPMNLGPKVPLILDTPQKLEHGRRMT